jgi:UDP-2,3-diacylglucosamine pyrophosphatase LpxH
MANPGTPEAQLRKVLAVLEECDGNQSEAARRLGLDRSTLRHQINKAKTLPPRPAFAASPVPSAEMESTELIAHLAARSRKYRARFHAEKNRRIAIDTKEPFAIAWFTDVHLGDNGTDYDLLVQHCEMVADSPHTYGVFMGDASNNWPVNGKLGKQWAEQETSKHQERQLVEWFLKESGVPWLFWALGNHDTWGDGETILRMMNADLVPMASWGAKVTLEMANGRECRLDLAHDHKGSSIWNSLHAETKAAQTGEGVDFVFSGHRHNAALHFEEFAVRDRATWLMRCKGYKQADSYAFVNGFPEQTEGHAGVTVIDPTTSRSNPIIHASLDIGEGLDYLKFVRRRAAA